MTDSGVPCPLCEDRFLTDDAYVSHLADTHGLHDDAGTNTTLEQAVVAAAEGGIVRVVPSEDQVPVRSAAPPMPQIAGNRVYDPHADDERFRPMSVGIAGIVIVGLVAFGYLQVRGSTSTSAEEEAAGTTSTTAPLLAAINGGAKDPQTPGVASSTDAAPVPTATEAAVVACTDGGDERTLTFGYLLGGTGSDGHREETVRAPIADGPLHVATVRVANAAGQAVDVTLEPGPLTCG